MNQPENLPVAKLFEAVDQGMTPAVGVRYDHTVMGTQEFTAQERAEAKRRIRAAKKHRQAAAGGWGPGAKSPPAAAVGWGG